MKKVKNTLLKYVTLFLSLFSRRGAFESHNIFIISTTAIGDSLWATPALRYIKEGLPNSTITMLTREFGTDALQNNPYVDHVLTIRKRKIFNILIVLKMMWGRYSTTITFHSPQRSTSFLGYLASPGAYYGMEVKDGTLFTELLPHEESKNLHKVEMRLLLAQRYLKIPPPRDKLPLEIYPLDKHYRYIDKILNENIDLDYAYVHIGASQIYKRWHPDYFEKLIKGLSQRGFMVLMSGNMKEQSDIMKIADSSPHVVNLGMPDSILYLAAAISKCKFVVTNDTGPMHIASALHVPIFAFFLEYYYAMAKPYNDSYKKIFFSQKKPNDMGSYITDISLDSVTLAIDEFIDSNI